MPRHSKSRPEARVDRVRKNMDMDPGKLRDAQRVLGTRSETETVDRALDQVVYVSEVFTALDALAALGGLDDPYAPPKEKRRKVAGG